MELYLLSIYSVIVLLSAIYMGYRLFKKKETVLDEKIRMWAKLEEGSNLYGIMKSITRLGNVETLFVIIVPILFFLIRSGDFITATSIIISAGSAIIVTQLLKFMFRRNRPTIRRAINHIGYSFPSGHAAVGISFYLTLSHIVAGNYPGRSLILLIGLLIGLSIAYSRISLGVHWASDVGAGILIGFMCAWWAIYLYRADYILRWLFQSLQ